MTRQISESDWKTLRRLQPQALERFCQRVLDEIEGIRNDATQSAHERYLAVYRTVERRDQELGDMFNDVKRSTAFTKLALMRQNGLIEDAELASFSEELRAIVAFLGGAR